MDEQDEYFIKRCRELAQIAASEGESPVGSLLVKDGKIIGEGSEKSRQRRDITRHAEIVAILDALKHLPSIEGTTLYTNVEPCLLCSYAIRHYKIAKVVFQQYSGELGGTHQPFNLLTSADIHSWATPPQIVILNSHDM